MSVACGVGPSDPPCPRRGPAVNNFVCLVLVSVGCILLVAWVLRTPQPRWGPAVIALLCLSCSVVCSHLVLHRASGSSLTDTLGGGDPSPNLHSKFILSAGLLSHSLSALWGPVPFRHLVPTLVGGVSLHCSIISNHLSIYGGVGARGMPSRTPPTPPLPARGGDPLIRVPSLYSSCVAWVLRTPPAPIGGLAVNNFALPLTLFLP